MKRVMRLRKNRIERKENGVRRIFLIIISCLFLAVLFVCYFAGDNMRDMLSPKVVCAEIVPYIFENGRYINNAVPAETLHNDENGTYLYVAKLGSDYGEKAHYVEKLYVSAGESDSRYTEIIDFISSEYLVICEFDSMLSDGGRVVIENVR